MEQKMADLPKERIIPDLPPFTNVGVDYFGPVEVKRGRTTCKCYGVIFTCLVSRAVHLEVALHKCFTSLHKQKRSGCPYQVWQWNHEQIQRALIPVEWSFNPPAGSHHGGLRERLIHTVKRVLSSILGCGDLPIATTKACCLPAASSHTLIPVTNTPITVTVTSPCQPIRLPSL